MSMPTVEEVVARMKTGVRFRIGSGRYQEEYWWNDAKSELWLDVFDEGYETSQASNEGALFQQMSRHPEVFGGTRPTLAEVIERMKGGETIQSGGGRLFEVYGWDAEKSELYRESVDEGHATRNRCSEQALAAEITAHPQVFAGVRYR